jgi:predicted RNA-binding protein
MLRGFKMLRKDKGHNFSLKLFEHNSERFTVVLKLSLWKVTVYKKVYAYADLLLAERIYDRILEARMRSETLQQEAA